MSHDAELTIAQANQSLASSGINAAQIVYQSALLDWVDDVTMGEGTEDDGGGVAKLWLAYAALNRGANLFKSATEVYEQAIHCPVAGKLGEIWLEYAKYLEERERPHTAQKIYIRALVGEEGSGPSVENVNQQTVLWEEFLRMMRLTRENPDLTLEELKKSVEQERGGSVSPADGSVAAATAVAEGDKMEDRPVKRSRWDKNEVEEITVISPASIDTAANVLFRASKNMPPEIETLWHARDGGSMPSPPEPPLFSPSPPKLGDPSGKDLLGNDVALSILRMMVAKTKDGKCLGPALLDLCHVCWMMTALKEDELIKDHEKLEKNIAADMETLETNLDVRLSVAGGALAAVEQANAHERNQFLSQCAILREQAQASSAWEFRKLLYAQQVILSSANLPGFDGPSVDSEAIVFQSKVCSVMHSAFYLRARVGETSHVTMLNKQIESLEKIVATAIKIEEAQFNPQFQLQLQPLPQFHQSLSNIPPPAMYSVQPPATFQSSSGSLPRFPTPTPMPAHLVPGQHIFIQPFNQQHGRR